MRFLASSPPSELTQAMVTVPSSSISMVVPVSSVSARMTAPPLPITSRILSGLILILMMRGANVEMSERDEGSTAVIFSRICMRPSRACDSATCMISLVMPSILMSICSAVMPLSVPATLKSMSPR